MRSESTNALGQPRLTKPTLGMRSRGLARRRVAGREGMMGARSLPAGPAGRKSAGPTESLTAVEPHDFGFRKRSGARPGRDLRCAGASVEPEPGETQGIEDHVVMVRQPGRRAGSAVAPRAEIVARLDRAARQQVSPRITGAGRQ